MRIKTSSEVLENLEMVKKQLGFENNAQVLKLAVNFALNDFQIDEEEYNQENNGFEIDTKVLFGDDEEVYKEFLKQVYSKNECTKKDYEYVVNNGFAKLYYYIKISKGNNSTLVKKVLGDLCI